MSSSLRRPPTRNSDHGEPVAPRSERDQTSVGWRLAGGDPDALRDSYRLLAPTVRSYLRRFVEPGEIDDLVQLTFLELWRTRARYDHRRPLEPWVLTIARNRAVDHLRRRKPATNLPDEADLVDVPSVEAAEQHAWATVVHEALDRLGGEQRQVLELAYFDELTQREIAERLAVPLGTIKARTARGLLRLAHLLHTEGDVSP